jgi:hypothetical protein
MSYLNHLSFAVYFETPRPETLYNTCIDGWNSNCGPHTPSVLQTHFSYEKFTNRILTLVITYTLYVCSHFLCLIGTSSMFTVNNQSSLY